jgi:hypothetical protein
MTDDDDAELVAGMERVADAVADGDVERALIVGTGLAIFDALVAIRDGREWRGRRDAREIAGEVLREIG